VGLPERKSPSSVTRRPAGSRGDAEPTGTPGEACSTIDVAETPEARARTLGEGEAAAGDARRATPPESREMRLQRADEHTLTPG